MTAVALDDSSANQAQVYSIPAQLQRKLHKLDTTSTMSAGADLAMWSPGANKKSHHGASDKKNDQLSKFARGIIGRTSAIAMSLTRSAMRFIGTPYVFGGTTSAGFDCSGYVQHVFAMAGISIPRTADVQYYAGRPTKGGMQVGDLVFFQTYEPGPSHVGIYLGGGKFVHASSHGVRVSRLSESYWANRYIGAKRLAYNK